MARSPRLSPPLGVTADQAAQLVRARLDRRGITRAFLATATGIDRTRVTRILRAGPRRRWSRTLLALWNLAEQSARSEIKRTPEGLLSDNPEDRLKQVVEANVKPGEADRWIDLIEALAKFRG